MWMVAELSQVEVSMVTTRFVGIYLAEIESEMSPSGGLQREGFTMNVDIAQPLPNP